MPALWMPGVRRIETTLRGGTFKPTAIAVHTTEGTSAASSANWCKGAPAKGSCPFFVDCDEIIQTAPFNVQCWHVNLGNSFATGLEFTGRAEWSAAKWAEPKQLACLDNGRKVLRWMRDEHGLMLNRVTPEQLKEFRAGVAGHRDFVKAGFKGSHIDPGDGFPLDALLLACNLEGMAL